MRAHVLALAGALGLFLAGCAAAPHRLTVDDPDGLLIVGCYAEAAQTWRPLGKGPYTVNAIARGPTCPQTSVALTVRNAQNDVIWTDSYAAAQVMTLAYRHQDSRSLRDALAEWIDPETIRMRITADLPPWPEGANEPSAGEFPFYPEPWVDRAFYVELRRRNLPMYCYVQGMESIACLVLDQERLEKIGVQSFPG